MSHKVKTTVPVAITRQEELISTQPGGFPSERAHSPTLLGVLISVRGRGLPPVGTPTVAEPLRTTWIG